jgi:hypothetical protein
MFWRTKITNTSYASKEFTALTIKQSGNRLVVQFNLDDGTFFDLYSPMPRFAQGEELNISLSESLKLPTTEVEQ